jgi:hypothetical protein
MITAVRALRTVHVAAATALLTAGCITQGEHRHQTYLSENEILDLMAHPRRWDGRTVTVLIYPYYNGFSGSYIVCFEPCNADYAERSPFLVYLSITGLRALEGIHRP